MAKNQKLNITSLLILLGSSVFSIFSINSFFAESIPHPGSKLMRESVTLARSWFVRIVNEKANKNILSDAESVVEFKELLGNDYSEITTTLGSLESKELSTNPDFAAVITKILLDADINHESKVGVVLSASFPALAISTLAALQTIGSDVVVLSSLGASAYGANQPGATWIDMENWLIKSGGLIYSTDLLTIGAENDNGLGMTEEGISLIKDAIERNDFKLFLPTSLEESISVKYDFLKNKKIKFYINIGGNQASLGSCSHVSAIPNGFNMPTKICSDPERGLLSRFSESGIPFLHLLNLKELAVKTGIPLNPGITYGEAGNIYSKQTPNKLLALCFFCVIISVLVYSRNKKNKNERLVHYINK